MQDKAINNTHLLRFALKLLFVSALLLPFLGEVQAQAPADDVVYLKNGTVLRGKITEIRQDTSLKVQVLSSNTFTVKWEDMERFEMGTDVAQRETPRVNERSDKKDRYRAPRRKTWPKQQLREKGYYGRAEAGIMVGDVSFFGTSTGMFFYTAHGFRFSPNFSLGLGTGLDRYTYEGSLLPIHLDARGNFTKNSESITGFWFASGGYALGIVNSSPQTISYDGGLSGTAGMGMSMNTRYKFTLDVNLGYKIQQTERVFEEIVFDPWTGQQIGTGNLVQLTRTYNRLFVGFGIGF